MYDVAHCSPTTSLSAYVLVKLAESQEFSSVYLCGRRFSAECEYYAADGLVKILVEAYARRGRLKLFGVTDSDDVIYAWLVAERFHIILDMTGASNGKIDGVLSRPRTAVQVAYLGYPGPAFGVWDFVIRPSATSSSTPPSIVTAAPLPSASSFLKADASSPSRSSCRLDSPPTSPHNLARHTGLSMDSRNPLALSMEAALLEQAGRLLEAYQIPIL